MKSNIMTKINLESTVASGVNIRNLNVMKSNKIKKISYESTVTSGVNAHIFNLTEYSVA